jgi:hypothetical protein
MSNINYMASVDRLIFTLCKLDLEDELQYRVMYKNCYRDLLGRIGIPFNDTWELIDASRIRNYRQL